MNIIKAKSFNIYNMKPFLKILSILVIIFINIQNCYAHTTFTYHICDPYIYGSNGVKYQIADPYIYASNGMKYRIAVPYIYASDGIKYRIADPYIYASNGIKYRIADPYIYASDGTTYKSTEFDIYVIEKEDNNKITKQHNEMGMIFTIFKYIEKDED